jgi:hypothetical protein
MAESEKLGCVCDWCGDKKTESDRACSNADTEWLRIRYKRGKFNIDKKCKKEIENNVNGCY